MAVMINSDEPTVNVAVGSRFWRRLVVHQCILFVISCWFSYSCIIYFFYFVVAGSAVDRSEYVICMIYC